MSIPYSSFDCANIHIFRKLINMPQQNVLAFQTRRTKEHLLYFIVILALKVRLKCQCLFITDWLRLAGKSCQATGSTWGGISLVSTTTTTHLSPPTTFSKQRDAAFSWQSWQELP